MRPSPAAAILVRRGSAYRESVRLGKAFFTPILFAPPKKQGAFHEGTGSNWRIVRDLANARSNYRSNRGSLLISFFAAILFLLSVGLPLALADSVHTLDGRTYSGSARLTNNALVITETNGTESTVGLSNLQSALFFDDLDIIPGERTLFGFWANQDIGNVGASGGARQLSNSVFAVRGSGTGVTPKIDGFHFVYLQMGGDGEIVARISDLQSKSSNAQAGLIIRQTLGPESAEAALLVSQNQKGNFFCRASRKKTGPEMRRPIPCGPQWVKLAKTGKFFTGSVSDDGLHWEVVGGETISLGSKRNLDDQWFIGLAVSSHTNSGVCAARFDEVSVRLHGLKAELFSDDFKTATRTLILSNLSKSARSLDEDHTAAIRWTGQILAPSKDVYSFSVASREKANLWINDKPVQTGDQKSDASFALEQGEAVNLRLETRLGKSAKHSAVVWYATRGHPQKPVNDSMLRPYAPVIVPASSDAPRQPSLDFARFQATAPGLVLKNGTFLAGAARELEDPALKFIPANGAPLIISALNIARIQFRSLSPQLAARITNGTPGLLLANGDFIEGELKKLSPERVTLSSIILGLRSYEVPRQVAAIVLRDFKPARGFAVRSNHGSAFYADALELKDDRVIVSEPTLGKLTFALPDLIDIRRVGGVAGK